MGTAVTVNEQRAEEFAAEVIRILNGGSLALMTSIGHRTGLFDVMSGTGPATSEQIASKANLDERYVREWLGAMTVGGVVEHDAAHATYALPVEHALSITRAAGPNNLAAHMQLVSMLADVEDDIVACFREGGGLPYSEFPTFTKLMAEMSAQTFDATLIDTTLPLVDGLPERLAAGIDVADIGCGSGHAVNLMAQTYPESRFTGIDFSEDAIAAARAGAGDLGLTNAEFVVADAADLDGSTGYDFITAFDTIHDQARPDLVLAGIAKSLRPDGVFLCVDIAADTDVANNVEHPLGPFIYSVSTMHCMTVSLAEGGMGLGTAWGEQKARQMLTDAGFTRIEVETVDGDILNNYYIAHAG